MRPDSDVTRRQLVALFDRYLDHAEPDTRLRSNFSVRRPSGLLKRRHGELYIAGWVARRSKRLDALVHTLTGHLAGLAANAAELTVVHGARVFTKGDRAVLVKAPRPCLAEDSGHGHAELACWDPRVDAATRTIVPPPSLEGLNWRGAEFDPPPAAAPASLHLVGVIAPSDPSGAPDVAPVWINSTGDLDAWGLLLAQLQNDGRVIAATNPADVAAAIETLLH